MVFTITLGKWFRHGQLSLGGLFKSFNLDLIIFLTNNTFFIRHCFTTLFDKYIYKLILLSYSFKPYITFSHIIYFIIAFQMIYKTKHVTRIMTDFVKQPFSKT